MKFTPLALRVASLGLALQCVDASTPPRLSASVPNPVAIEGILGNKLTEKTNGYVEVSGGLGTFQGRGPVGVRVTTKSPESLRWLDPNSNGTNSTVGRLSAEHRSMHFNFTTLDIGSVTFEFQLINETSPSSPVTEYRAPEAVDLTVIRSYAIEDLSQVFGWIYFSAWGVSFLPQIWENFRHKSVVGLNFDFVILNLVAFTCYAAYYILFYFDPAVGDAYHDTVDPGSLPIAINDLCFAVWAFTLCALTAFQVFIYERGDQRISIFTKGLIGLIVVFVITFSILAGTETINMLTYAYGLSYVKVGITFIKLVPQVYQNYKRKQTTGMSIYQWWLDLAGGIFSLAQQMTDGANAGDWIGLFGNAPKTMLAFEALLFDAILFTQHYLLYRQNNKRAGKGRYHVQTSERTLLLGEDEGVL